MTQCSPVCDINCVFADGGAGGPAAPERGPSQRQRAVGEGEQNGRGAACGPGHLEPVRDKLVSLKRTDTDQARNTTTDPPHVPSKFNL